MIMNRPGAKFEYDGITYVIGAPIIATPISEYRGLHGIITEIRDGNDKELCSENDGPIFFCEFDPPSRLCDIKELEAVFSDLYQQPKTIEDITFDLVIMTPDMVAPLDGTNDARQPSTPL